MADVVNVDDSVTVTTSFFPCFLYVKIILGLANFDGGGNRSTGVSSKSEVTDLPTVIEQLDELRNIVHLPVIKKRRGRPKGSHLPFNRPSSIIKKKIAKKIKLDNSSSETDLNKNIINSPISKAKFQEELVTNKSRFSVDTINAVKSGGLLDDTVMNAAQDLLKQQFHHNGLQSTLLCQSVDKFAQTTGDMIQVLFQGNPQYGHWVSISTVGCETGCVQLFDSMNKLINKETKKQVSAIVKSDGDSIKVNHVQVQKQIGGADCGLFAIAFLVAVCFGKDPSKLIFDQNQMREHLLNCFHTGEFTMFPYRINTKAQKPIVRKFNVHCVCRGIDDGSPMILCDTCNKWFHTECVGVDVNSVKNEDYNCSGCCSSAE